MTLLWNLLPAACPPIPFPAQPPYPIDQDTGASDKYINKQDPNGEREVTIMMIDNDSNNKNDDDAGQTNQINNDKNEAQPLQHETTTQSNTQSLQDKYLETLYCYEQDSAMSETRSYLDWIDYIRKINLMQNESSQEKGQEQEQEQEQEHSYDQQSNTDNEQLHLIKHETMIYQDMLFTIESLRNKWDRLSEQVVADVSRRYLQPHDELSQKLQESVISRDKELKLVYQIIFSVIDTKYSKYLQPQDSGNSDINNNNQNTNDDDDNDNNNNDNHNKSTLDIEKVNQDVHSIISEFHLRENKLQIIIYLDLLSRMCQYHNMYEESQFEKVQKTLKKKLSRDKRKKNRQRKSQSIDEDNNNNNNNSEVQIDFEQEQENEQEPNQFNLVEIRQRLEDGIDRLIMDLAIYGSNSIFEDANNNKNKTQNDKDYDNQYDKSQTFWIKIIEPRYSSLLPAFIINSCREKLFPLGWSTSQLMPGQSTTEQGKDSISNVGNSPNLVKLARQSSHSNNSKKVPQSPTMALLGGVAGRRPFGRSNSSRSLFSTKSKKLQIAMTGTGGTGRAPALKRNHSLSSSSSSASSSSSSFISKRKSMDQHHLQSQSQSVNLGGSTILVHSTPSKKSCQQEILVPPTPQD